jgi:hypothetical protein
MRRSCGGSAIPMELPHDASRLGVHRTRSSRLRRCRDVWLMPPSGRIFGIVPEADWCAVSYDELTASPSATLNRLCEFAGVDGERCWAVTAGGRLPSSRHTLTEPGPEKWRASEAVIARVLPDLDGTWRRLQAL